jgi:MFS transporter, ACS family, D-galactonate transporter
MRRPMHVQPDAALPTTAADRTSYARFVVLAAFCATAFIAYTQRNSMVVAESTMRRELGLTESQMGVVMSAFLLTYALLQIPAGALGKRWGTRRALACYSFVWSLAAACLAIAAGFWALVAARLAQGAGQAGAFPCTTVSIGRWMPPTSRAVANGILASAMSLGGAAGTIATGYLLDDVGWRWTFALFALPGLVWSLWFYFWFRDDPAEHTAVNAAELRLIRPDGPPAAEAPPDAAGNQPTHEPTPWRAILTDRGMICVCGQQFFRAAGYIFFATWFATYLQETRHVSVKESGVLTSLPLVAVVLAGFVGGGLSDGLLRRTGSRRMARQGLSFVSLLISAGLTLAAYFVADPLLAVTVISGGSFAASLAGPCAYAITIDMGGRHTAAVFSTMNMLGNLGGLAVANAVPWFVKQTGQWDAVLFLFTGISLAAALFWLPFDSRRTIGGSQATTPAT